MIFSFVNKPYESNELEYINSNIFNDTYKKNKKIQKIKSKNKSKIKDKSIQNANKQMLSFSNITSFSGSMFQRIQYSTSGCGVCGGK